MADAADSKSAGGDIVRVQVPPSAFFNKNSQTFGKKGLGVFRFIIIKRKKKIEKTTFFL